MPKKPYERAPDGVRLDFGGINIVRPPDQMPARKYPYAQNVRAYLREGITSRVTQDSSLFALGGPVHSIRRLNDTTPGGPAQGFVIVSGVDKQLFANSIQVDSGLSGNPISLVPFRPNTSVQPWMYVGDSLKMDKVRSDNTTYKMGIMEPQVAPNLAGTVAASLSLGLVGNVTVTYWGDSPHSGPTGNYIWKFNSSAAGSGPVRSVAPASGTTIGSSLLFDESPFGSPSLPMNWTQYATISGQVNTSGTSVTWVSGTQFTGAEVGQTILINNVAYLISVVGGATAITLQSSAGVQTNVAYSAQAQTGSQSVFQPQLESEGYSDFNFAVEGLLYVPFPGTYRLQASSKDEFLWGIGASPNGTVSFVWNGGIGQTLSSSGQTTTALNNYPLISKAITPDGGGQINTSDVLITFSAAGNYPFEIDYDYWFHSNRRLIVKQLIGGASYNIAPIPSVSTVIANAQYRYVYRSSPTGAVSNPSPPSAPTTVSSVTNTLSALASTDPQVDKIDWYRIDSSLTSYTYVGTGPNSNATFSDSATDAQIVGNPQLEFDNFEPFPSIDLPASGTVNVGANGLVTWASGTQFKSGSRGWLPGTIVVIGTSAATPNQGTTWLLYTRPTSPTKMTVYNTSIINGVVTFTYPQAGTGFFYQIAEPILAAQPLAYMWGPTDNVAYAFACGDPLRPGTLYWSKGNNLDSAPDTNSQEVTSPSEPLQNGVITNGIGFVMSTERGFLIYPNFFNALATVTGTIGNTWTIQESIQDRGLFIPTAICVDGGGNVFFRAKDGIYISPGGQGSKSITDDDLYPIFPHEGYVPQPKTLAGFTVWPPDDSKPTKQRMTVANGYVYYDYYDANSIARTLVYDIQAQGWVVDVYEHLVRCHVLEEGVVNGTLVGCEDGTIRPLTRTGAEVGCSIVLMGSFNAGETRAEKHFGDLYIEVDSGA